MKKLFCVLLALMMLLSVAACGNSEKPEQNPNTVTVYVPETVMVTTDGKNQTLSILMEDGWQTKDSSVAQCRPEDSASSVGFNMHYDINSITLDYGEGAQKIIHCYDQAGNLISQTTYFSEGASVEKNETVFTYDERGRMIKQEAKIYLTDVEEPVVHSVEFTYVDAESGSKGAAANGNTELEKYYDVNDRLIREVTTGNGEEITRTEMTYDSHGNLVKKETYVTGVLTTVTETVYKAYVLDAEKASQMPYFHQEK